MSYKHLPVFYSKCSPSGRLHNLQTIGKNWVPALKLGKAKNVEYMSFVLYLRLTWFRPLQIFFIGKFEFKFDLKNYQFLREISLHTSRLFIWCFESIISCIIRIPQSLGIICSFMYWTVLLVQIISIWIAINDFNYICLQ